jgi:hypothetical protein
MMVAATPANDPPPSWAFLVVQPGNGSPPADAWVTVPGSKLHLRQRAIDKHSTIH